MIDKINFKIVFNIIGFYICWWSTIYSVSINYYFIGPLVIFLFLIIHFYRGVNHRKEDIFLLICFILGTIIETTLLNFNIIIHNGILTKYHIAPLWSIMLWVCFGATLYHSFKWMSQRYIESSILGALLAPIVYFSFRSFGIVEFGNNNLITGVAVSIIWGLFIPLFIKISDRKLNI